MDDPEVQELTSQIREVVGKAYTLSKKLDGTLIELRAYAVTHDRRKPRATSYKGRERRSG